MLVVRDLMFKEKHRYGDFLQSEEHMATNILADRLRRLEEAGIVRRHPAPRNAGGLTYKLTDKGIDLAPILVEAILWSAKPDANPRPIPGSVAQARDGRDGHPPQRAHSSA